MEVLDDLLLWKYIDGCERLQVWDWKEERLILATHCWIFLTIYLTQHQSIADDRMHNGRFLDAKHLLILSDNALYIYPIDYENAGHLVDDVRIYAFLVA